MTVPSLPSDNAFLTASISCRKARCSDSRVPCWVHEWSRVYHGAMSPSQSIVETISCIASYSVKIFSFVSTRTCLSGFPKQIILTSNPISSNPHNIFFPNTKLLILSSSSKSHSSSNTSRFLFHCLTHCPFHSRSRKLRNQTRSTEQKDKGPSWPSLPRLV